MGIFNKITMPQYNSFQEFYRELDNYIAPNIQDELDIVYVDANRPDDEGDGRSWENAKSTIQAGLNLARRQGDGSTLDTAKNRHKYVFVWPGQYNEKIAFSGYNIHLIGVSTISNGDYGVVVNYDDAIVADYVMAFSGAGLEIANICLQSTAAIPILNLADTSDAVHVHDCWIKGDNSKTVTIGISANIKNSIIENNIINGCITGINVANGAWFNNTVIRDNKITNVTNGINLASGCIPTESQISHNFVIGSSTSIVNGQATDVIITENFVSPEISDAGSKTGLNTTLKAETTGDIESKIDNIITYLGGEAGQLRVEQSKSGAVEEDAYMSFGIGIFDIDTGAIASGSIDISGISATLEKSTGGAAFSSGGITQPTFAKANGLVSVDYRFLAAEWEIGDVYKLTVSGITATIGSDTAYVKTVIWSNVIMEQVNVEGKIDAIQADLGDFSAQSNLTTLLAALGIPDVAGKPLHTLLVTDRLDNATYGLSALNTDIDDIDEILRNGRDIWYCDSSVGASGAGTEWDTAFKTITEAVTAASAGDVIKIRGEFSGVTEGATIELDKELWLIGENTTSNQGCTMIYNGGAAAYPLITVSAHQCKIFNIYFSQISSQNSIEVGAYWKCHIKGCKFDEAAVMVNIPGDSPDTTIEDCLFRSWTTYAIDTYCTRAMIKNCRFIDVGSNKTAIRHASNGGNRPDTAILDCRFHTYDNTNGVAIEVTNTPTAGYLYIDNNHFSYYADDNHAVSKRTGYCGINWRDAAVLPVT